MSSNTSSCVSRWNDEVNRFENLLFASIALTLVNIVVSRILITKAKWTALKLAYYHGGTGSLKILLAVAIFASIPTCPSGCTCYGSHVNPIVAVIPLLIGSRWLYQGYVFYQKAKSDADNNAVANESEVEAIEPSSKQNEVV